ncbi:hypothetical protein PT974_00798 [Cladobotryum mycophilum]|uniref:Uncharacterized protein n=1 Tax=Cladobotryum mycophilum TaxID=491253 RepID=A0ABR0T2F3_9HYPO
MSTTTLGEALTRELPTVDSSSIKPGGNTTIRESVAVDDWVKWDEFNYQTLFNMYGNLLSLPWPDPPELNPIQPYDLEAVNEHTFEDILVKFIFPTINTALQVVGDPESGTFHIGRGTRCQNDKLRPDWSLVSGARRNDQTTYINLLPGDSKVHCKWSPELKRKNFNEWAKPVRQIATYMAWWSCRYGFIITEANLVLFRIARELVGGGLGSSRPRRHTSVHYRMASADSDISMLTESLSLGGMDFEDDDAATWEYLPPQYVAIPWTRHGNGQLTAQMALFYLSLMATGDRFIASRYPALDSWARRDNHYIHNTSGRRTSRLPQGAVVEEPEQITGHSSIRNVDGSGYDTPRP